MCDVHHCHYADLVIDPVDDPVGAAARTEAVVQRWEQALADAVRMPQQWAGHEFVGSGRHSFGESLTERTTDSGRNPKRV
jgi:hypothetical protein